MILDDTGEDFVPVRLGKFQRYAHRLREQYLTNVIDMASGDETVHLHAGDLTQGKKYPALLMSDCDDDQCAIATANLGHAYRRLNPTHARIISGTAAHVGLGAASEKGVTRQLAAQFPQLDLRLLAHPLIDLDGVTFDAAHHGPSTGSREWLKGNVARYYLRSQMWWEFRQGKPPADVYIRAHYHEFVHEWLEETFHGQRFLSHLVVLPSWCGMSEFSRKVTRSKNYVTNGLVVFEVIPGDQIPVRVHPLLKTLDLRTRERL